MNFLIFLIYLSYVLIYQAQLLEKQQYTFLFKYISENVENFHRWIAGFDISYDEFEDLGRNAWKTEECFRFNIDR